jgi:hypothetical protein
MTTDSSVQLEAIYDWERSGRRNGFSERLAVQNNSSEIARRKGDRLLTNPVQRANRNRGRTMKKGTKRWVNRAVVRPAIIENRGSKNGLSINGVPFHAPQITVVKYVNTCPQKPPEQDM